MSAPIQQAPPRNRSVVGVGVYSHSGEFTRTSADLIFPGRGLYSFNFTRSYRSSYAATDGALGLGWTFTYAQWIERQGDNIVYHDGLARVYTLIPTAGTQEYTAPHMLYAILARDGDSFLLKQQTGPVAVFDQPEAGGRLRKMIDLNGNSIQIDYQGANIRITDALGNRFAVALSNNRVTEMSDFTGRSWNYVYDANGCLIQVLQPATPGFPDGTQVTYGYDSSFRLASITDPKGQTFLRNSYDDLDRVTRQDHGSGYFQFSYKQIGTTDAGSPIYQTQVRQKNGGVLTIAHDAGGHAIQRTLGVRAASFSLEDRGGSAAPVIPVTTKSVFSTNSELVERTYPAGNVDQWVYDENQKDPRDQGNLLSFTSTPAHGIASDQEQITIQLTYEPQYQCIHSIKGPRGTQSQCLTIRGAT
jgi:hypothetical protein